MKLLIRAPMIENDINSLKKYFDTIIYLPWTKTGKRYYEDEMLSCLKEYKPDAVITELDKITEKVLSGYHDLKVIGDCRANPANIDIETCTKAGIPVLCTPARNSQAVAEMVIGLVLSFYRNIIPSVQWIKDKKWVKGTTPYYLWMGYELHGKKVGFVGFGAVGKAAANLFEAFGCEISFYDPYVEFVKDAYKKSSLEQIFADNDIISLHLPDIESTHKIINQKYFSLMKESALFVNSARSAVVDMEALYDVLNKKKIAGAIIDVLETEPPEDKDLKILSCPNVLLTPHICGASYEVTNHQSEIITNRFIDWFGAKNLDKIVYNNLVLARK
jgi:D-3-phosphoglycerate dehydrogenase / 2-oxoglutarate reductase